MNADVNHTWVPNDTYGTWCAGETSAVQNGTQVVECSESFSSYGGLDSCAGGQFAVGRLIVIGQCFDTHLEINGKLVDKGNLVGACSRRACCYSGLVVVCPRRLPMTLCALACGCDSGCVGWRGALQS